MKHPKLPVTKREIFGKKLKVLRRDSILPANIYGKEMESLAVQVHFSDFQKIYDEVGETGIVDVELDGKAHPALIKNLQMNHREHLLLHADFYKVNLKEKIKTMVPLEIVGEPVAVTEKIGTLLTPISEIEVEALPEGLPENIEVNVEKLAALDEQITVADLKAPEGVAILTDPGQIVAKIAELAAPEPEPEPETPAEGEEGAAAAEGEAPAEGEEKAEEGKSEEKSE